MGCIGQSGKTKLMVAKGPGGSFNLYAIGNHCCFSDALIAFGISDFNFEFDEDQEIRTWVNTLLCDEMDELARRELLNIHWNRDAKFLAAAPNQTLDAGQIKEFQTRALLQQICLESGLNAMQTLMLQGWALERLFREAQTRTERKGGPASWDAETWNHFLANDFAPRLGESVHEFTVRKKKRPPGGQGSYPAQWVPRFTSTFLKLVEKSKISPPFSSRFVEELGHHHLRIQNRNSAWPGSLTQVQKYEAMRQLKELCNLTCRGNEAFTTLCSRVCSSEIFDGLLGIHQAKGTPIRFPNGDHVIIDPAKNPDPTMAFVVKRKEEGLEVTATFTQVLECLTNRRNKEQSVADPRLSRFQAYFRLLLRPMKTQAHPLAVVFLETPKYRYSFSPPVSAWGKNAILNQPPVLSEKQERKKRHTLPWEKQGLS